MKQNEFEGINEELRATDLANLFNVYDEPRLGYSYKTYNVNRTLNVFGLDNAARNLYSEYEVKDGDTWTLISYRNYETIDLWWLVCKVNSISDPSEDPEPGQVLRILNGSIVQKMLDSIREG